MRPRCVCVDSPSLALTWLLLLTLNVWTMWLSLALFRLRHGHWFHQKLLARSLQLFHEQELYDLERELQDKLAQVRVRLSLSLCLSFSTSWLFYQRVHSMLCVSFSRRNFAIAAAVSKPSNVSYPPQHAVIQ